MHRRSTEKQAKKSPGPTLFCRSWGSAFPLELALNPLTAPPWLLPLCTALHLEARYSRIGVPDRLIGNIKRNSTRGIGRICYLNNLSVVIEHGDGRTLEIDANVVHVGIERQRRLGQRRET